MKLSDGEKLILMMLAEIYKHLKIKKAEFDPDFISETIVNGYLWGLKWKYHSIPFEPEDDPPDVKETANILDMWRFLEEGYENLSKADKAKVDAVTGQKNLKFIGFDGNHEDHFGIARYFVEDLKRWGRFKGRDLNSHTSSVDGYRRILRVFEPMRSALGDRSPLNADEIARIMNARRR